MKRLTVIIVNWNVRDLLVECLKSVSDQTNPDTVEMIVVDNNSSDGSVEAVKTQFPNVKLMANRENVGYGKAINQAAAVASGDFLFVLNPDTIVSEGALKLAHDFMLANPKVGIGGCHVFYPDGRPQESFYRFPTLLNSFSRMFSLFRIVPRTKLTRALFWDYKGDQAPDQIDRVFGAVMVIRRAAFEETGGFDEDFFMYGEEVDLCFRVKSKGWEIAAIPGTRVVHHHEQSSKQNVVKTTYHRFKGEYLFFKKHYSTYKVICFRLLQFLGILMRWVYWSGRSLLDRAKELNRQKLRGYSALLLSDFNYRRNLLSVS